MNQSLQRVSSREMEKLVKLHRSHRQRVVEQGENKVIDITKLSPLWMLLPNGKMCLAPTISRTQSGANLIYSGRWVIYKTVEKKAERFSDRKLGSPYISLSEALTRVKEVIADGETRIPGFYYEEKPDGCITGVHIHGCFGRTYVCRKSTVWSEDLTEKKTEYRASLDRDAIMQEHIDIIKRNRLYLFDMLEKHARLLKVCPNSLPAFDESKFKVVIQNT